MQIKNVLLCLWRSKARAESKYLLKEFTFANVQEANFQYLCSFAKYSVG